MLEDLKKIIKTKCKKANRNKDFLNDPITIADILNAVQLIENHSNGVSVYSDGEIIYEHQTVYDEKIYWDLRHDDLNKQTIETLERITYLLDIKKSREKKDCFDLEKCER